LADGHTVAVWEGFRVDRPAVFDIQPQSQQVALAMLFGVVVVGEPDSNHPSRRRRLVLLCIGSRPSPLAEELSRGDIAPLATLGRIARYRSDPQADKVVLRVAQPARRAGRKCLEEFVFGIAEILIVAAAAFSSSRWRWLVPGIGTI
jgi:hypothetical protein